MVFSMSAVNLQDLKRQLNGVDFNFFPPNDQKLMKVVVSILKDLKEEELKEGYLVTPYQFKDLLPFVSDIVVEDLRRLKNKVENTDLQLFIERECEYLESIYRRIIFPELIGDKCGIESFGNALSIIVWLMILKVVKPKPEEISDNLQLKEFINSFDLKNSIIPLEILCSLYSDTYSKVTNGVTKPVLRQKS